jgi:hypothetical protein
MEEEGIVEEGEYEYEDEDDAQEVQAEARADDGNEEEPSFIEL